MWLSWRINEVDRVCLSLHPQVGDRNRWTETDTFHFSSFTYFLIIVKLKQSKRENTFISCIKSYQKQQRFCTVKHIILNDIGLINYQLLWCGFCSLAAQLMPSAHYGKNNMPELFAINRTSSDIINSICHAYRSRSLATCALFEILEQFVVL